MRYTQIKAFDKHLESSIPNHLSVLYCILGKDFAERTFLCEMLKQRLQEHFPQLDCYAYRAEGKGEKEFLNTFTSASLFDQMRWLSFAFGDKLSKNLMQILEEKLPQLTSANMVVLSGDSITRNSSFYKLIEKHGIIFDMGEEKAWEKEKNLLEWLMMKAKQENKAVSEEVLIALVKGVGANVALLSSEWQKLLTYTLHRKTITWDDVQAICCLSSSESTWGLGEALLQSHTQQALKIAFQAIEQGSSPLLLLRQLRHQLVTALHLASYHQSNQLNLISVKFPYLKGKLLEKQVATATRYGIQRLTQAIQQVDASEFQAKDGRDDAYTLFTKLIGYLS